MVYGTSNKKWENYVYVQERYQIGNRIILLPRLALTGALTNMKLGREMKLYDPMNRVTFKSMYFLENNEQPRAIHYKGHMYVHVTDKKKTLWKMKLDTFYALTTTESSVNIVFLGKYSLVHKHELMSDDVISSCSMARVY